MRKIFTTLTIAFTIVASISGFAQSRLVFNTSQVYLRISNNANLVLDNSNTNAITTSAGANIISEGENNVVKWRVGTGTGTYTVPYTTNSLVKIPLQLNITAAGTGTANSIIFSTYETATDANTTYPSDVTNMNSVCTNSNALYAVDRFWRIDAGSYGASKPTPVINFGFNPAANETAVTNTITLSRLKAERFNAGSNSWETPMKLYGLASGNTVAGASVTPTDFHKSWTLIDTVVMTIPISLTSASSATICEGSQAVITPTGATTYTIMTGGGSTTTSFTVAPVATTIYTITGSVGSGTAVCKSAPGSAATVAINVNATPTITSSSATSATLCSGQSYTIGSLTGGTGNYTLTNTGATSATQFVVTPSVTTTYTVIGANASGCISLASSDLNVAITVNASPTLALATSINTNTLCSGNSATITLGGASAGSTYTLFPDMITGTTSIVVTPTATSNYTVIATDNANGCVSTTATQVFTTSITISTSPTIALSAIAPSATLCSGQSVTITPTGGVAGSYTLINNPTATEPFVVSPTSTTIYTISGVGANGCVSTSSSELQTTITVNQSPTLTATSQQDVACFGNATGSVTLVTTGGTPLYTYNSTPTVGLSAGGYTYTVTDDLGCSDTEIVTISQPTSAISVLSAVETASNSNCVLADGSASVAVTGGTGTYTVTWDNNTTGTSVTGLNTGLHTFTITDSNGCTNASNSGTVNITGVTGITTSASLQNSVSCLGGANGAVTFTTTGGTATYTLTDLATSTTTVNTTGVFTNLVAGTYSVYVLGVSGCVDTEIITISQPTTGVTLSNSSISVGTVSCFGGTAVVTATATGGVGSYIYTWSGNTSTSNTATYLAGGPYTVTVMDGNNCSSAASPVTFTISQPSSSVTISSVVNSTVACNGGTTTVIASATGGTGAYTYQWNGVTGSAFIALPAGNHTLVVIDANGCASASQNIIVTQPTSALSVTELTVGPTCATQNTGMVEIMPIGGTPGYTVAWSNSATTFTLANLTEGPITGTVTDANGCVYVYNTTIAKENCINVVISNMLSPNGDGINEPFVITGLEQYPNNKLEIYNRWGSLIFSKAPYDNTFNGKANVSGSMGTGLLPSGTYFVVVDFGDDQTPVYRSYLELKY